MNKTLVKTLEKDVCVVMPNFNYLDAFHALSFRQAVMPHTKNCRQLILDCSEVKHVDSTGLASLIHIFKTLKAGGEMRLVTQNKDFLVLLEQSLLHQLFPCFPSVEEAAQSWVSS